MYLNDCLDIDDNLGVHQFRTRTNLLRFYTDAEAKRCRVDMASFEKAKRNVLLHSHSSISERTSGDTENLMIMGHTESKYRV